MAEKEITTANVGTGVLEIIAGQAVEINAKGTP